MRFASTSGSCRRSPCRFVLQQLEDRTLLSGSPLIREVTVMSRNLYLGADLTTAIVAASSGQVVPPGFWNTVRATDFPQRAEALADEIALARPTLIGLQEAVQWHTGPFDSVPLPGVPYQPTPASNLEYDFLATLEAELAERGLPYAVAVVSINWVAEAPAITHRGLEDLRLTDRDAILVRTDLPPSELSIAGAQAQQFVNNRVFPLPLGPLVASRSWQAVDATIHGRTFRFVNTHLEPESLDPAVNAIQVAQANELLAGPGDTPLPTVFLGDFNSRADGTGTATYGNLLAAGFSDAWTATDPGEPGNTHGHAENLTNVIVAMTQRIDLVLLRGDVAAVQMEIVGEELSDRLPSGLWPSDHAGVVAKLRIHVPAAVESMVVNDGAAQRSMVNRLTIQFSEAVTLDPGAIQIIRQSGHGSFATQIATYVANGKTVASVTFAGNGVFAGSLADGRYQLKLHNDGIRDADGNRLDGDGNGTEGVNYVDAFFRLFGDGDGDADVDWRDALHFLGALGKKESNPGYLRYFDYDNDGEVDLVDLFQFLRRLGSES